MAKACLDFGLHLRHSVRAVSVVVPVGIRLGKGVAFLMRRSTPTAPDRAALVDRLEPFDQQHLIQFWDELSDTQKVHLADQIGELDFAQINELFRGVGKSYDWAALARRAAPPTAVRKRDPSHAKAAQERGRAALAAGEVGVLLVAGGQGSRLGFAHPKGMFPIGPISGAPLLQIHFEKALAVARRYRAAVPIYMMTSPVTHDEQAAFLAEHKNFGLPPDDFVLFTQGTMPAVDAETGRLLLADKDALFLSPNGHGGTVAALSGSGAIDHMRRRGIRQLFYLQVDNALGPICDAEFIGYHLLAESELTSMAVAKQEPRDKLGNFVLIDGQMQVIEYSDFPDDVAERRNPDGSLTFWAGSIAVHMFDVAFLERMLTLKDALPFHIAHKKVPHVNESGNRVEPGEPNALKFERFIFDLLPHANNPLVVEFPEQEVLAPVKNAPGAARDTPEFVQHYMIGQHRRWLIAAGVDMIDSVPVEISPLWALDAEGVAARTELPASIDKPTYLRDEV